MLINRAWLQQTGLTEAQIGRVLHADPSIFKITAGQLEAFQRRLVAFGVGEAQIGAIAQALASVPGRLHKVVQDEEVIESSFRMIQSERESLNAEEMAAMIEKHPHLLAVALDPASVSSFPP